MSDITNTRSFRIEDGEGNYLEFMPSRSRNCMLVIYNERGDSIEVLPENIDWLVEHLQELKTQLNGTV